MSRPTSWRISAWMTASISISSASAPATSTIAPYWPSNQPAVRSGLAVLSISPPTFPVTQTAASVTQAVTPRITNSPAAPATVPAAPETTSQTLPTIGSWHGFGGVGRARAGVASGPASTIVQRSSASAALAPRTCRLRSAHAILELAEGWDGGERVAGRLGRRGGERRGGAGAAGVRTDLPAAVFPGEVDGLCAPRLLRLNGGAAADDADVPDRDRRRVGRVALDPVAGRDGAQHDRRLRHG